MDCPYMVAFLIFATTQSTLQQVSIPSPELHLPTHAYVQSYFAYVHILLCLSSFFLLVHSGILFAFSWRHIQKHLKV